MYGLKICADLFSPDASPSLMAVRRDNFRASSLISSAMLMSVRH